MAEAFFEITPHEEAIGLIKKKAVVSRSVFDSLLPELRARAFTISGVEDANVQQSIRDAIAKVAEGATWDDAKKDIIGELDPWLGDGAERRAELLLKTHAFQAFQASNWRVAQEDEDTTHLQYLATEDDRVRDSHAALNGLILPKNDPFWEKHYPPWEWGCRCSVRPMNPDLVEEARLEDENRNPEDRLVMEGPALKQLRDGTLIREGQRYDVTAPSDSNREGAFEWHPDNLRIPLDELEQRYDPEVFAAFKRSMEAEKISDGVTLLDWLKGSALPGIEKRMAAAPAGLPPKGNPSPNAPKSGLEHGRERAAAIDRATNKQDKKQEANKNWKPYALPKDSVDELTESIRNQRLKHQQEEAAKDDAAGLAPGSEKIPETAVPKEWVEEREQERRLNEEFNRDWDRLFALAQLYERENPDASDAIREWRAGEFSKLRARYKK